MTRATKRGSYAVGKGKPPVHTQFRKGQSGNPGGRPRGVTAGRAQTLALEEAYRVITVKDGKDMVALPALQAILRSQIALAAKGNGPAQRAVIAMVQALEDGIEAKTLEAKTLEAKTAIEGTAPIPQFEQLYRRRPAGRVPAAARRPRAACEGGLDAELGVRRQVHDVDGTRRRPIRPARSRTRRRPTERAPR